MAKISSDRSPDFDFWQYAYNRGWATREQLWLAYELGQITLEEFYIIVGEEPPEPELPTPDPPSNDPESVVITPNDSTLSEIGSQRYLTAVVHPEVADQTVTWTSSDDSIVSVDQDGKVWSRGQGTVTITATAVNGVTGTATVTAL